MEAYRSELNLFTPPEVQSSIVKSSYTDVDPEKLKLNSGPIEFEIFGNGDYIDLNDITLFLHLSMVNENGTPWVKKENSDAAFINVPFHSIFSDVKVYFNDVKVCGGDSLYAYTAMTTLLLSYSRATLKQQFASAGFAWDEASKMDDKGNSGHNNRQEWNNGRLYIGKLLADVFQIDRYLLSGTSVKITLMKAEPEFALMSHTAAQKPKFIINDARLSVRRVKLADEVVLTHERALNQGINAIYPYSQKVIIVQNVSEKDAKMVKENLFKGALPKVIVIGLVSTDAYVGSYTKNPYNFQNFNVSAICLKKDGENVPYAVQFEPNFGALDKKPLHREYMSIFTALNMMGRNDTVLFDNDDFANGYCLYAFNLTPDQSMTTSVDQSETNNSNLRLELKFSAPLKENVTVLIMGIFDGLIQIDRYRNVYSYEI